MNSYRFLLYIFLLFSPTIYSTITCDLEDSGPYIKDEIKHPVCFSLSNSSKIIFYPPVDEFSLLEVDGSYNHSSIPFIQLVNQSISTISFEIDQKSTGSKIYIDTNRQLIVPFFTVIIRLYNGILHSVSYDDGCLTCDESHCLDNNCAVPIDSCDDITDCDLKVYVSWIGSDAEGNQMISASKRFSRFRQYSLFKIYESAVQSATGTISELSGLFS